MAQRPRIGRPGQFAEFRRFCIQKLERASLVATDKAARGGLSALRGAMRGAGLGGLGNALGYGSDLKKNGRVHRIGPEGYRASGWIFVRTGSERGRGAIEAYTEGAEIRPVRSRWLWIATREIRPRVGRKRMTPDLYRKSGMEQTVGPLVSIPGRHRGERLLIVRDVTVDRFGRPGRARRVPRRGAVGGSRERKDFIVAFVGITGTSRAKRVDVPQIIGLEQARLPEYRDAAMRSGALER